MQVDFAVELGAETRRWNSPGRLPPVSRAISISSVTPIFLPMLKRPHVCRGWRNSFWP